MKAMFLLLSFLILAPWLHAPAVSHALPLQGRLSQADTTVRDKTHEELFEELLKGKTGTILTVPNARQLPSPSGVFYPNVNISVDTAPQNEPSVRISHKNPDRMVAAWRDFRTGVTPAVRRVGYSFSNDGGATWSTPDLLPQIYEPFVMHSDPAVCVDTSGIFYIATVALTEGGNGKLIVFKSSPAFDVFDQAYFVPTDTLPVFYDKEYIECDLSPSSPYANNLYVAWSGVGISRSTNEGVDWSDSLRLSDPGNGGGAPDMCIGPDGLLGVSWLRGIAIGSALVMFDRSTDGGTTFGTDVVVDTMHYNYDCLSGSLGAGFPSVAADITSGPFSGNIYAVWADAREGDYDIALKASADGGSTWSGRRRVNEDPVGNGRHQFWPWIAVDDRGVITIVYYDNRNTPDSCEITDTYLAYSWDGGLTFTNVLLSNAQSPKNMPNSSVRYGDYIGIDSWGGRTVPVWTDERTGGFDQDIYTAVLDTLPMLNFSGLRYDLLARWNLLSLPVVTGNDSAAHLFPDALTGAFAWNGSYVQAEILEPGAGYWIKYPAEQVLKIFGDSVYTDTIEIHEGWNLIGPPVNPVPVPDILTDPPGLVTGPFFGYAGTYVETDTLIPGRGYWVNATQPGSLIMGVAPSLALHAARIVVTRTGEAPPSPPFTTGAAAGPPLTPALIGNYPNPFNPSTRIRFTLPAASRITMEIYNILGEEVATLAESRLYSAGRSEITFDASGLPSGVYVCRMSVLDREGGRNISSTSARMLLAR